MPKEVQVLVDETVALLKNRLINETPDKEKATKIIKECLQVGFSQVAEEDHKALYKKLSMKYHPDKIENTEPEVFAILKKLEIPGAVMQELGNYQEYKPNMFQDMAADPVNGTKNFLFYLWEKLQKMLNEYERYPQPFRLIVNITHWVVTIALLSALVGAGIFLAGIYFGIIWPVVNLERLFVNLVTDFRYDLIIETLKNDPVEFAKAKKEFLTTTRTTAKLANPQQAEQIDTMSDEELYKQLVLGMYQEKLQTRYPFGNHTADDEARLLKETEDEVIALIKSNINEPTGFDKVALQAVTLGDAIASPLPEESGDAALQVMFVKPLQVLITPVVLLASILIETARYLHTAAIFIAIGAAVAAKLASVIILNLPLYTIDAIEYLINSCSEGCTLDCDGCMDSVQQEHGQEKPGLLGSPMTGLFGSKYGSEVLVKSGKPEPEEQGSYVKLFTSVSNGSMPEVNSQPELPQASM